MCRAANPSEEFVMPEKLRPVEQMLELSEEEGLSPEHLDSQVQRAQDQLLQLKRQQEQIEKQKRELEELSRRQEELERGRAEHDRQIDPITRGAGARRIRYPKSDSNKSGRCGEFWSAPRIARSDRSKNWNPGELHKELSKALSAVDDARAEYSTQRSRLQAAESAATLNCRKLRPMFRI